MFLAPGESADKKNMDVVRAISANSAFIDENNWGVIPLAPTRAVRSNEVVELEEEAPRSGMGKGAQHSSTAGPLEQGVNSTAEPNHADFQALKHNVTSLPALVLTTASGDSRLGNVMDGRALTQLCRNGGVGLHEWLGRHKGEACSVLERERQEKGKYEMAHTLNSVFLAKSSAAMIQGLGFRLLLIEPEGFLKKRTNVSLKPCKLPEGQQQIREHDSFFLSCVPFLRAVLLPPADDDGAGCGRCKRGDVWHPTAPSVALCTDFGQQVQNRNPKTIENTLSNLRARLAAELGVTLEQLSAKVSLHVSYLADSAADLPLSDARSKDPAWSRDWCKPRPGMLLAAMAKWETACHETLAIGYDARDVLAAGAAGITYINGRALLHTDDPFSQLIKPGTALPTQAPADFNPGAQGFGFARS